MPALPPGFLARPFAHRGLHDPGAGIIENSRAAVAAAVAAGYGIEIDVQLSADGAPMVFHDDDLPRLTGAEGPLAARSAAALAALTLAGGDEGIPTLDDILALVAGRVPLLIEIKDQDGRLGPAVGRLEARVAHALRRYAGPVAVMSFNPHSVAAMAAIAPALPRGLTTCRFEADDWPDVPPARRHTLAAIPDARRLGVAFVSHDHRALDDAPVAALRGGGLPVICWTIRTPAAADATRDRAAAITFEGFRPDPAAG